MEKLKPAGAFHKDLSNKTLTESERNISVELNFMRSINGDGHQGTTPENLVSQDNGIGESKSRQEDDDDIDVRGKLVDDEELDRYLQALTGDVGGRDDKMEMCSQDLFDDHASTEKNLSYKAETAALATFQSESDNHQAYHYTDSEHGQNANPSFDHRIQSSSYNAGDETIQKRLHRAILSPDNDSEAEYYENQPSPHLSTHSNDEPMTTMVQNFSLDSDDSDEDSTYSPLPVPVRANTHTGNEHNLNECDNQNLCEEEDSIDDNQNLCEEEDSIDSFGSRGEEPNSANSWDKDTDESNQSTRTLESSKVPDKKGSLSFDSDCSYLPDDDFATANWDSD